MDNEISQEGNAALALNSHRKACERLRRAGAQSTAAMQRRVKALATERSIPPADYAKLFHKRVLTQPVLDFCKKHKVSMDWLLCRDLKGLQRMTHETNVKPVQSANAQIAEVTARLFALPAEKQRATLAAIQTHRLASRGSARR